MWILKRDFCPGKNFPSMKQDRKRKAKNRSRHRGNEIMVGKQNNTQSGESPLTQRVKSKKSLMMIKESERKKLHPYRSKAISKVVHAEVAVHLYCYLVFVDSPLPLQPHDSSHPLVVI